MLSALSSTPLVRESLVGRRVLVPGGTGAVGEGIVRAYLAAGAEVVVPTRSAGRQSEFRALLGPAATDHLHLPQHDYSSLDGAERLAVSMVEMRGGIDDVVAPIGGWWAGKNLWEIDQDDWNSAFVQLATTHLAMARAVVPRLSAGGTYMVIVGQSAQWPVPGSGLISMEQAAVLMMQRVLAAEVNHGIRVHALVLGPVRTRLVPGDPGWVSADEVGAVAVALSTGGPDRGTEITLADSAQAQKFLNGRAGLRS
jgi:NAD(P)-dependent dehydrogenase (short-subunit alcohol dehydrogenase family)